MSYVAVYPLATPDTPNKVLTHFDDIVSTLVEHGVGFDRWQPSLIEKGASNAEMIAAYQSQIDALGYGSAQVSSVTGDHPQRAELRAEGLKARRYSADNVHFFIAGQGLFCLLVGEYVYAVRCEKNDVLVVPAGCRIGSTWARIRTVWRYVYSIQPKAVCLSSLTRTVPLVFQAWTIKRE